jgi:hypothetical protein
VQPARHDEHRRDSDEARISEAAQSFRGRENTRHTEGRKCGHGGEVGADVADAHGKKRRSGEKKSEPAGGGHELENAFRRSRPGNLCPTFVITSNNK